jgi:hypothetical protein
MAVTRDAVEVLYRDTSPVSTLDTRRGLAAVVGLAGAGVFHRVAEDAVAVVAGMVVSTRATTTMAGTGMAIKAMEVVAGTTEEVTVEVGEMGASSSVTRMDGRPIMAAFRGSLDRRATRHRTPCLAGTSAVGNMPAGLALSTLSPGVSNRQTTPAMLGSTSRRCSRG